MVSLSILSEWFVYVECTVSGAFGSLVWAVAKVKYCHVRPSYFQVFLTMAFE